MDNKKLLAVATVLVMVLSGAIGFLVATPNTEAKVLNDEGTVTINVNDVDPTELSKLGEGASWSDVYKTLTLENVIYRTSEEIALKVVGSDNCTIKLVGENVLSSKSICIDFQNSVVDEGGKEISVNTFNGNGSLSVSCTSVASDRIGFSAGINSLGKVSFIGCNVNAEGGIVGGDAEGSYGIFSGVAVSLSERAIVFAYGGDIVTDSCTAKKMASSGVMAYKGDVTTEFTITLGPETLPKEPVLESYLYGYGGNITYTGDDEINIVSSGAFTEGGLSLIYGVLHGYGGDVTTNANALVETVGVWSAYKINSSSDVEYMISEMTGKGGKAISGGNAISAGIYIHYPNPGKVDYNKINGSGLYGYGGDVESSSKDNPIIASFGILIATDTTVQITIDFVNCVCEAISAKTTRNSNDDALYCGIGGFNLTTELKSPLVFQITKSYFYASGASRAVNHGGSGIDGGGIVAHKALHTDGQWVDVKGALPSKEQFADITAYLLTYQYVVFTTAYSDESPVFAEFVDKKTMQYTFSECDYLVPDGYHFDHWQVGWMSYQPGDTITLTENQYYLEVRSIWVSNTAEQEATQQAAVIAIVAAVGVACGAMGVALIGLIPKH